MSAETWEAVRRDYEAGMSLRALALKYGCSKSAVDKRAKRYGWERGQGGQRGQVSAPVELPELEASEPYQLVTALAVKLLDRVGETLETPKPISARDLRGLAAALLDVRQLLNAVSPVEAEEQRLRIESLRRQTESGGSSEVTVRFVETEGAEE